MGLAEGRVSKAFETQNFPAFKAQIDQAAGFDVPMVVEWASLAEEGYDHLYGVAFPKVYFEPIIEALKVVAIDDLGREALRDGLKSIHVRHSGNTELSFIAGTLLVDHAPASNIDHWEGHLYGGRLPHQRSHVWGWVSMPRPRS